MTFDAVVCVTKKSNLNLCYTLQKLCLLPILPLINCQDITFCTL